jgi:hypothetical protein
MEPVAEKRKRKQRTVKSFVWKYFVRNDAGNSVNCTECSYVAKYYGTTSGMKNHLKQHHQITAESEAKRRKLELEQNLASGDDFDTNESGDEQTENENPNQNQSESEIQKLYQANPRNQKLAENMVNWMADANISLNAFMKPSFIKLVSDLNSNVKPACRQTFSTSIIPKAVSFLT